MICCYATRGHGSDKSCTMQTGRIHFSALIKPKDCGHTHRWLAVRSNNAYLSQIWGTRQSPTQCDEAAEDGCAPCVYIQARVRFPADFS